MVSLNRLTRIALRRIGLVLLLASLPTISSAGIIWNGDFSTGDFTQYHSHDSDKDIWFWMVPAYGRPTPPQNLRSGYAYHQTGNGELLDIVTSPTRGTPHSARFRMKSVANMTEPDDCDPGGNLCTRRRTTLWMQRTHARYYNALPHMGERWVSWSIYLNEDWPSSGSGFGNVFSLKMEDDSYQHSGYFRLQIEANSWKVVHTWLGDPKPSGIAPWQQSMFYTASYEGKPYPRSDFWPEGLRDYPDEAASVAALGNLNKGGWTDWVLHFKQDHRGAAEGGTGFFTLWKREDSGPWVKVLHILPKQTTRGGMTFDHGIGYNLSATAYKGAGINAGFYMDANQVHPTTDRVMYMANIKIGDENTTFAQMTHDGSSPGSPGTATESPPQPPSLEVE